MVVRRAAVCALILCLFGMLFSSACSKKSSTSLAGDGAINQLDGGSETDGTSDGTSPGDQTAPNDQQTPDDTNTEADGNKRDLVGEDQGGSEDTTGLPKKFLEPCQDNSECESGFCVKYRDTNLCSKKCLTDCPDGWGCLGVENSIPDVVFICVPKNPCGEFCPHGCNVVTAECYDELEADAGSDKTIPSGGSTQLNGAATGGDGNYACRWLDSNGDLLTGGETCAFSVSPKVTTVYTLEVTDGQGNKDKDTVTVSILDNLTADAGPDQDIITGNTADLSGSGTGGTGNLTCEWLLNNQVVATDCTYTTPALSVTTTYTLKITDGSANSTTDDVVVNVHDALTANAGDDKTIIKGTTTTLSGSSSGGIGTTTCRWLDSVGAELATSCSFATPSLDGETTYTLEVKDSKGNTATDQITIGVADSIQANAGADAGVITGQAVTLNGTYVGGIGTITCDWFVGTDTSGTPAQSSAGSAGACPPFTSAALSSPTSFTLRVTDQQGNADTDEVLVSTSAALQVNAGDDQGVINGETATLNGTYSGGVGTITCDWFVGTATTGTPAQTSTGSAGSCPPFSTSALNSDTTFTLRVTDTNGNTLSDQVEVKTYGSLTADAGTDRTVLVGNTELDGSFTGGVPAVSCSWSDGLSTYNGCKASVPVKKGPTEFTLTVTDKNGNTATDKVVITGQPIFAEAGNDQQVLQGETATLNGTYLGGIGAITCDWFIGTDTSGTPDGSSSGTNGACGPYTSPALNSETVFTLRVTDSNGDSDSDTVTVDARLPLRAQAGPDKLIAPGGSATINGGHSGGVAPVKCDWFEGSGTSGTQLTTDNCTLSVTPGSTTTYTLRVTDANNDTDTDEVAVIIQTIVANAGPDKVISLLETASLDGTSTGGVNPVSCSWEWYDRTGVKQTQNGCTLQDSPPVTTSYTLTVTDNDGNSDSDSATVFVLGGGLSVCNWQTIFFHIRPDLDNGDGDWTPDVSPCDPQNSEIVFRQAINADPTGQLSDLVVQNVKISGSFWVGSSADNDYIGFIWGWQDQTHFYMLHWKQDNQNNPSTGGLGCGNADRGISILKFDGGDPATYPSVFTPSSGLGTCTTGTVPCDYECYDFWNNQRPHELLDAGNNRVNISELLVAPKDISGLNTGWIDHQRYRFELVYKPGESLIRIYDDGDSRTVSQGKMSLVWQFTMKDASYPKGRIAWYMHSQKDIRFGLAALESCAPFKAWAGRDRTLASGDSTTLYGGVTCFDKTVTCQWRIDGQPTVLSTNCTETFSPTATTTYQLTVTDTNSNTSTDTVTVTVN